MLLKDLLWHSFEMFWRGPDQVKLSPMEDCLITEETDTLVEGVTRMDRCTW